MNPFAGTHYVDGDKDWDAPEWRKVLDKELVDGDQIEFEKERQKNSRISENETGIKHPVTGATIVAKDDGSIEVFANEDLGFRLDPKENAIIFYGDAIHMATKDFHVHTRPDGFKWNSHAFNPWLYHEDETHDRPSFQSSNGKSYDIFQKKDRKSLYDDKISSLLKQIGVEVEER